MMFRLKKVPIQIGGAWRALGIAEGSCSGATCESPEGDGGEQASGPRAPLDLGEAPSATGSPSAPWLSRASSPAWVPESPLHGLPGPLPSLRVRSPSDQTPATPKRAARAAPRSLLSSPSRVPEYPLQGSSESRSQIKASFPLLSVELRDTCRNLHGGSLDWRLRALRAWEAGCWARAVLDQRVSTPNSLGSVGLPNRLYCVLVAEGLDRPCVVRTFAAYKAIVGELRPGGSVSHGFPSEAEARLYFAGGVTLLEFQWPFPADPDADGEETLAGQSNEEAAGIGPSLELMAPAVRLSGQKKWRTAESGELVAALVVDLPASLVGALSVPELTAFGGVPFMQEDPGLFPLASDVLRQTQEWAAEALGELRSGYHTAAEEPVPRRTYRVLGLQPDLPASVYQDVSGSAGPAARAFSPLAEQKWVTIGLSYLKEVETITARRAELQPPRKHPQPPHVPPEVPKAPTKTDQEALTKKQARGAAWAAKRAAASKLVLKSGTAFGHFLSSTLPLCRDPNLEVATALFPLPLPSDGLFLKRSRKRSQKRRLPYLTRVAHHVLVMSLNFLHSGGKHIPPACLRRPPSELQASALHRLMELVKACARLGGSTLTSGRRGIQLAARHAEVLHFLRAAGLDETCYFGKAGRAAAVPEFGAPLVPHLPGGPEDLAPYRDLDSDRIALSGTGSWPLERHLGPDLLMLYLEPRALRSFVPALAPGPTFEHESRSQTLGLFRKWDALGLLGIVQGPLHTTDLVRIFGAYKDPGRDRQIGDRRNVNNKEARIVGGPSSRLPAGSLLTRLSCPLPSCALFGSCVDRQDFYHQAKVSESRGRSNAIGPVFSLQQFYGTQAYADFMAKADKAILSHAGACSLFRPASVLASADLPVHGTFLSLLQGDHAGVEFACAGHEGLLRSCGVLGDPAKGRLLNRCPVACHGPWTGLIIDDLFCISCERSPGPESPAAAYASESERLLRTAKNAYECEGVPGSDHKDQFSQRVLWQASLVIASGRWISEELASILAGSWVTALLYRRALMAAIGALFSLGKKEACSDASRLRPLPSAARQDLVLLAALVPAMVSNVSAEFSAEVSCSDASSSRGAVCTAAIRSSVAAHLWQTADQRGWYTRLGVEASEEPPSPENSPDVERPIACRYDFIEVRCGGPWLTGLLGAGCSVGPVVDFRASPHFSLREPRCLEWILFMLQDDRLRSVLLVPPVGSFSSAFLPRVRAWDLPRVRVHSGRTRHEDAILRAALCVLLVATRCNAIAIVLHPLQSFARGTPEWRNLCARRGAFETTLVGCDAFSTAPQPAVALVSAAGRPELARALPSLPVLRGTSCAGPFADALRASLCLLPTDAGPRPGLESLLFNDVMLTSAWQVTRSWAWRDRPQNNVLEARSFLCALRDRAGCGQDRRFVHGLDSYVSLGALTKGRTSSIRLLPLVKQSAAIQAAYGLYPGLHFCPTRLNTSDDPTRCGETLTVRLVTLGKGQLHHLVQGSAHNLVKAGQSLTGPRGIGNNCFKPSVVASWLVAYGRQLFEAGGLGPCFQLDGKGIFGLSWGGLLRIGEATSARRCDLILPSDVLFLQAFALIRIEEPKTRMRMARHQSAKLEQSDLVALAHLAFADLQPSCRLWPQSAQTLRRRFDLVLERIGLPTARGTRRPLDLGSFRPGGATFLMRQTEDSELVRRRGRWASQRVMEIYIQEVQAAVYFPALPFELREKILCLAHAFTALLEQARTWKRVGVPPASWYSLFSAGERPFTGL
ncbi:unnamed protein product [Symbiodinium sp. CCMP2592]|nr:unnamed protein product [Symbiodinium sp. CCMP2592]